MAGKSVQTHRKVDLWVFQKSVIDHFLRAAQDLFPRLEHELDAALQLAFMLLQDFRRRQKHGRMQVVAAGVAVPILCRKGKAGLLFHRKRVHVAPEKNDLSAISTDGCDAGFSASLRLISIRFQLIDDECAGLRKVQPQFRELVQGAPVLYDLLFHILGFFQKINHSILQSLLLLPVGGQKK